MSELAHAEDRAVPGEDFKTIGIVIPTAVPVPDRHFKAEATIDCPYGPRRDHVGFAAPGGIAAVTIHRSQGSEYPAVVIPLAMQHYTLLERNLLYTGVTRGRQLVVIVGQAKALAMAVRNVRASRRLTHLAVRLAASGP